MIQINREPTVPSGEPTVVLDNGITVKSGDVIVVKSTLISDIRPIQYLLVNQGNKLYAYSSLEMRKPFCPSWTNKILAIYRRCISEDTPTVIWQRKYSTAQLAELVGIPAQYLVIEDDLGS